MYKEDLALNNPKWFICHKTNQTKYGINLKRFKTKMKNTTKRKPTYNNNRISTPQNQYSEYYIAITSRSTLTQIDSIS